MISKIERCRICGNSDVVSIVDIGEQYLSSVFPVSLNYRDTTARYPLALVMCRQTKGDSNCGLIQLAHRFDLTSMYQAYPYTSSSNSSMKKILEDIAKTARNLNNLKADDVILDIGGNDGTLLSFFKAEPFELINIDPAQNVVSLLEALNYTHVRNFFSAKEFQVASKQKAKLIFSIAMFYHLNDPLQFVKDVEACLDDDGVWLIQMAYLPAMIRINMYDNIVHEHAGYYGAQHLKLLIDRTGLEIFDIMENDVYGGSFRILIKKKGNSRFAPTRRYRVLLDQELKDGIFELTTYQNFMRRVGKSRTDLRALVAKIKAEGKTIWIYGASTKGNTIMQFCGLGRDDIVAAADSNPFKIGKYMIGSDIPIKSEEEMRAAKPDYLLSLPYSFTNAFMKREAGLVAQGTRFIVPLPEVKII